ncbi:RNA polymerase sigma factor [bacterium]|nr:RNA polymerase sigma factor [bacterium]
MNSSDLVLLCQKMQQGDQKAFSSLYECCYAPLYRYIFGMTFSRDDAEDITQETFLKVARAIRSFKTGSVMAWMYTIARNILFDRLRKSKYTTPLREDHENSFSYEEYFDEELLKNNSLLELREHLQHLTLHEREMIFLKYWNDMDMKQIAELVGKSHEATRKEISRIMSKLRTMWENKE